MKKTDYTRYSIKDPARRTAKSQFFRDRLAESLERERKNPMPGVTPVNDGNSLRDIRGRK